MSNYILDKAYTVADEDGVGACIVVVAATNPGECTVPTTANASRVLGVTLFSQPNKGRAVTVRKAGIVRCMAAGRIDYGDPVIVADHYGKVCPESWLKNKVREAIRVNCIGFAETIALEAGDIVEVFLSLHQRHI